MPPTSDLRLPTSDLRPPSSVLRRLLSPWRKTCRCGFRAVSYATYPLAVPRVLLVEVRRTAEATGLSLAEAMRQSMKLGLPRLREQLGHLRITNVEPLPDKVARQLYAAPDDDSDAIALFMAAQAKGDEE